MPVGNKNKQFGNMHFYIKMLLIILLETVIILISFFQLPGISAKEKYKKINFPGLKIYTEEYLLRMLDLNNAGISDYVEISKRIKAFYIKNGFLLVKTYKVQVTADSLIIYIDEGHLDRIVFRGLNIINTVIIKNDFELKERIFNKITVESEIKRLKKKYNFKDIIYTLIPAQQDDNSFFLPYQDSNIPGLGTTRLPFPGEYDYIFNLEIKFIRTNLDRSKSLTVDLKTSYNKGFIPEVGYDYPSFLYHNDFFKIRISMGLFYGFDLKFKNYPKWTFFDVNSDYYFAPSFKEFFTPMVTASASYSKTLRKDIGLISYNYLKLKSIFAPGITLLNSIRIYTGAGVEKVHIYIPKTDPNAQYIADPKGQPDTWAVFESRIRLDIHPWTLKFETIYNYYKSGNKSFYELNNNLDGEKKFRSIDPYVFSIGYQIIWKKPPFYHEYSVSDADFKGFMGKSYHTRNILKLSNEYKFSIYRDSYYFGLFTDFAEFEGSGYDLKGSQQGIVAGLGNHAIFLDQFEFNIYFGKDYLFSTGESHFNVYLNLKKKW